MKLAHFQATDVLFIYSAASGSRPGPVTVTWQTCEKIRLAASYQAVLYWQAVKTFQGRMERRRSMKMGREQRSCFSKVADD